MAVSRGIKIRFHNNVTRIGVKDVLLYLVMILLVAFTALPLIYVISTAFKPIDEILLFPPRFFVRRPTFHNFEDLVVALSGSAVPFLRYVFNSIVTAAATVLLTVMVSSMGAYALVKQHVPFGKVLFTIILMALMFPGQVTQIPNYLVVSNMGLLNSYASLIVPKIAVAYNMFLMKQFCEQLPDPILEAARIDGAGEWLIFRKIVFPFLTPAWATLIVFSFVSSWNDYFSPLVFIQDEALKTLPLALSTIGEAGNVARAGAMAAATFLTTLPTIVIFTAMQGRVIQTMAYSGIKE